MAASLAGQTSLSKKEVATGDTTTAKSGHAWRLLYPKSLTRRRM